VSAHPESRVSGLVQRARRIDLRWLDWLVAAVLIVDQLLESSFTHAVPDRYRLATAVFSALFVAPVAVRRRWPMGAAVACTAVAVLQDAFHGHVFTLPSESAVFAPILISYGLGAWLELRRSLVAVGLAGGLQFIDVLLESYVTHVPGAGGWSSGVGLVFFLFVIPWVLGRFVRERHRRAEAFAALAAQVEAERAERERAAIAEERVVIGRELQDIIAHSVSTMVVQSGGARRLLIAQPDRARESILTVEHTGREALAEMRRLLGVLRRDDDPRALTPQPGLDQLAELGEFYRARGLACEIRMDETAALTPGVDLVAYRVIEASLADATDQGCAHAVVTIRSRSGVLEVEVRADGSSSGVAERLRSVGERVALYDGRLEIEDGAADELLVRCRLPLGAALVT
jgi:signal transduction histidine kinase